MTDDIVLIGKVIRSFMVYSCPTESDPRDKLEDFVKNPKHKTIAGLRSEGLDTLIELVADEVRRQEPDSDVEFIDREVLSDNRIDLAKDLAAYFDDKVATGRKLNFLMCDDLPIIDWMSAVRQLTGGNAQVYCFSVACRQIPSCSKLL